MVSKEVIQGVFDELFNGVSGKCWTKAQIREKLSGLSYQDQFSQLKNQDLLNPLEMEDYNNKMDLIPQFEKAINNPNNSEDMKKLAQKQLDDIEDELFYYGRRLIEGLTYNEIPNVDTDNFSPDDQWGGDNGHNYEWEMKQGKLEDSQVDAQIEALGMDYDKIYTDDGMHYNLDSFEGKSALAMDNYFNGDSQHINYTISHDGYVKSLNDTQRTQMKTIDNLMEKSPGLLQDTILYRGGHFNIHLKAGDNFSFKGYVSTTFQESTSDVYKDSGDDFDMTYVIHAPKGTKGICGGDDSFNNNNWEHEYVLPRNTKFTVLSIDYDAMTCEVVIDE